MSQILLREVLIPRRFRCTSPAGKNCRTVLHTFQSTDLEGWVEDNSSEVGDSASTANHPNSKGVAGEGMTITQLE